MFPLHDIRKSRVWQEAYEEGLKIGEDEVHQKVIQRLIAKGETPKEIADLLGLTVAQVRRSTSRRA